MPLLPPTMLNSSPQLEVADVSLAPDEERVSLGRLVGRRLAGDRAVLDAPEVGIAVPAVERLAVEERLKSRLVGRVSRGNWGQHQGGECENQGPDFHREGSVVGRDRGPCGQRLVEV